MPGATASDMFGRLGKVLAVGCLLAVALAAVLSGSDRQSRDFPNSPSYVGWPYDTGAAGSKAVVAFLRTGPASAIGYASRSVISDPISVKSISMLGRSLLYSQRINEAHQAFVVAGQLGWRDEMTQIYWLDQALQGGDYKVAAERLDALLRQASTAENIDRFLPVVAATPEGRSAVADRLKLSPRWAQDMVNYLGEDLSLDQIMQRADLVQRTGKGVWDCIAMERLAQKLINADKLDEAQMVWRSNCENDGSLIYDGSFERLDTLKATAAFDWQLANRGDANIEIVSSPSGQRSLALEVTATITLPIVRQLVVLPPGRYRLNWRTPDTGDAQARALRVSLACQRDLGNSVEGVAVPGKRDAWSQEFTVDSQCPARMLVFWLAPQAAIRLDDVTLTAVDARAAN